MPQTYIPVFHNWKLAGDIYNIIRPFSLRCELFTMVSRFPIHDKFYSNICTLYKAVKQETHKVRNVHEEKRRICVLLLLNNYIKTK